MDDSIVKDNGNIFYIDDPNNVNVNYNLVENEREHQLNGAPPYEDMFIFAELTAVRKARTVLVTTEGNTKIDDNGFNETVNVNFIGNDQNTGTEINPNPNYLKFTTNYYDGSTGEDSTFESFGMTNIKVTINSSFVPQINIQFVDIRGLSFFNQKDSPYRILFDFPPPIFNLKIKGYYGKTLSYRLHLVKYTSEFKSENGNFIIDAQFVAVTYAPLTDVLFRYIINFPLINQVRSGDPQTTLPPTNTNEFIIKLKNLYSAISNQLKTDEDSIEYDKMLDDLGINTDLTAVLNNHKNEITNEHGAVYLMTKKLLSGGDNYSNINPDYVISQFSLPTTFPESTSVSANYEINVLNNLNDYTGQIKKLSTEGIPEMSKIEDRLIIAYVLTPNDDGNNEGTLAERERIFKDTLDIYRKGLIKTAESIGTTRQFNDITISAPDTFKNNYDAGTNKFDNNKITKYVFIDITDFYMRLYKDRSEIVEELKNLTEIINIKINEMILKELGMKPTIYNVFKVILNDVDTFFNIIRSTSREAEDNHHNIAANKALILNGQYADTGKNDNEKIYAFPLIINQKPVCGGFTEERISPLEISNSLQKPFPEMTLVDSFINTFFTQSRIAYLSNMKSEQNSDGSFKWIPISPIDSLLASINTKSPYYDVDTSDGGSVYTPINLSGDKRLDQVLQIVLNRFYVLTQSVIPTSIYSNFHKDLRNAYIKLYSSSEASNLAMSIIESKYSDNMKTIADGWNKDVDSFYDYVDNNINSLYSFTESEKKFITVSDDVDAYVDKRHINYEGVAIYDEAIIERGYKENSDNPVDTFQTDVKQTWFQKIWQDNVPENLHGFTQENVLYLKDIYIKASGEEKTKSQEYEGSIPLKTRFLAGFDKKFLSGFVPTIRTDVEKNKIALKDSASHYVNKDKAIKTLLEGGNPKFRSFNSTPRANAHKLNDFENVVDAWVQELSEHDTEIENKIINENSKLSALVYLSNFGWTLGPFNDFYEGLNRFIFDNPAAIDVPIYLPLYIGALISAEKEGWVDEIKDFFSEGGDGDKLQSSGLFIFADIHDVNNILSEKDKTTFFNYWDTWYNDFFDNIALEMKELYDEVQNLVNPINPDDAIDKDEAYEKLLLGDYFPSTIGKFLQRSTIVNFSQITFRRWDLDKIGYVSLESLNSEENGAKSINDDYFRSFFLKLKQEIQRNEDEAKKERDANDKLKGDDDILTQTYYSFKNINDKWLSSPVRSNPDGYPFNDTGKNLIDSFAFVDRAMNPIGDTIINPEILIDLFNDHNVSVFSVLSQLLSLNNFVFFPIQNFMAHSRQSWADSFKINTNTEAESHSAFVCMYIGGTSSYPTGIGRTNNGFDDDCIDDITTTTVKDFHTKESSDCLNTEDDNQVDGNTNFKENFRGVRAFRVKFGEQNQSMFKDIKIDSKEYPETNESIQILSRLAGDNKKQAPIPKGQNLYNLYENRAYKATVTGLGNAMIQPTQYFQLDNVPMFNGAYLILNVEHNMTANRMITSFSGTKILKFPIPRVKNPAALFDFEGGDSEYTNIADLSAAQIAAGASSKSNPDEAKYNSMYEINII